MGRLAEINTLCVVEKGTAPVVPSADEQPGPCRGAQDDAELTFRVEYPIGTGQRNERNDDGRREAAAD